MTVFRFWLLIGYDLGHHSPSHGEASEIPTAADAQE